MAEVGGSQAVQHQAVVVPGSGVDDVVWSVGAEGRSRDGAQQSAVDKDLQLRAVHLDHCGVARGVVARIGGKSGGELLGQVDLNASLAGDGDGHGGGGRAAVAVAHSVGEAVLDRLAGHQGLEIGRNGGIITQAAIGVEDDVGPKGAASGESGDREGVQAGGVRVIADYSRRRDDQDGVLVGGVSWSAVIHGHGGHVEHVYGADGGGEGAAIIVRNGQLNVGQGVVAKEMGDGKGDRAGDRIDRADGEHCAGVRARRGEGVPDAQTTGGTEDEHGIRRIGIIPAYGDGVGVRCADVGEGSGHGEGPPFIQGGRREGELRRGSHVDHGDGRRAGAGREGVVQRGHGDGAIAAATGGSAVIGVAMLDAVANLAGRGVDAGNGQDRRGVGTGRGEGLVDRQGIDGSQTEHTIRRAGRIVPVEGQGFGAPPGIGIGDQPSEGDGASFVDGRSDVHGDAGRVVERCHGDVPGLRGQGAAIRHGEGDRPGQQGGPQEVGVPVGDGAQGGLIGGNGSGSRKNQTTGAGVEQGGHAERQTGCGHFEEIFPGEEIGHDLNHRPGEIATGGSQCQCVRDQRRRIIFSIGQGSPFDRCRGDRSGRGRPNQGHVVARAVSAGGHIVVVADLEFLASNCDQGSVGERRQRTGDLVTEIEGAGHNSR